MIRVFLLSFVAISMISCSGDKVSPIPEIDALEYVDPFIGTGGHGHTYPGPSRPFGFMQLGPNTPMEGWDGCSGYHYTDSVILGFTHTHLSGTGVSDYGDLLMMPVPSDKKISWQQLNYLAKGYGSSFDKSSEIAKAGYYSVMLDDGMIQAELSTAIHSGMHKYTFQKGAVRDVIIDLGYRDEVLSSSLNVVNAFELTGHRRSKAWATDQHFYFVIQFEDSIQNFSIYDKGSKVEGKQVESSNISGRFQFDSKKQVLLARVGISAVSIEGARKNMEAEIAHFDFSKLKKESEASWRKELNSCQLSGGSKEERTIFYTALYHSYLNPNTFSDVDGQYRGLDGEIDLLDKGTQFTVFSLWDTYRATHPLFTITQTTRTKEFLETFCRQFKDGGKLPIWELAGNYTGCMIGYHAIPVIADAMVKGIMPDNPELMYEAMTHSANLDHLGLKHYKTQGLIPSEKESESVSKTLEYAYDDWCISLVSDILNKSDDKNLYRERGLYYRNLFDPETGFFRARQNGIWFNPFEPSEVNFNYTEANAWQYSMYAPQDIAGHISLMGGEKAFDLRLDSLFVASSSTSGRDQADITGLIGQYAHGNEPSHHMAYLYNYVGKPWKTQEKVRQIMDQMYQAAPDGLSGNEDCGQMSSWYVLSAMGIYPVTPGLDYYTLGSPLFDELEVNLENGNKFRISANGNSPENIYIQKATLNGKTHPFSYLNHVDLMAGGILKLEMGPEPNPDWGKAVSHRPKSKINDSEFLSVPYFIASSRVFTDSIQVNASGLLKDLPIIYEVDGKRMGPWPEKGLVITTDTKLGIYYESNQTKKGKLNTTQFYKRRSDRKISLGSSYANQYNGGGPSGLIDMQRGTLDFRTGGWQGYEFVDLEATIDLGKQKNLKSISITFLQDIRSWIWLPREVIWEYSRDGKNFQKFDIQKSPLSENIEGSYIEEFKIEDLPECQYIRITGRNIQECPDWHLGAGGKTWIFADEIQIEETPN